MNPSVSQSLADSSALAHLNDEQRGRLTEALERYMSALEDGAPLSQADLLAANPDVAEVLQSYFRSLELLHDMAGGIGPSVQPSEPKPDGVKQRVSDFELLREIGRGGMGVVYEARQISLGRLVAVKLLPFASVLDARQIARFKYEAQAAAQLQHPNIVSVFAVGVDAGVHYYAMPLIAGKPLDQVISEQRKQRPSRLTTRKARLETAVRVGIQAADALQAAHEHGVVHRDIKPSNLLLEADGKTWVTDFGLARCQRETSLTRTGDLIGTLRYMSPEQATGRAELVDHRTDVYSLGATLYELLCLRPAFDDRSGPGLLRQIDSYDPPRPRQLRSEIPADLETVILKAMARNRDDRYATARDFADDLRRLQDGKPIQALPPRWLEKISRRARRHQSALLIAFALTTAACIALLVGTLLIAREKRHAEQNAATADRRFREAREVVDRFGVELSQQLASVAGAENLRRELLTHAEQYYRDFVRDARNDPQLRSELANAYGRIAILVEEAGDSDDAVAAHQTAVAMFSELAADPRATTPQKRLAVARNNLGLALARAGRHDEAHVEFATAIQAQSAFVARLPNDFDSLSDLAVSHSNLGLLQRDEHADEDARGSFQAAASLLDRLRAARPDNFEFARRSAAVLNNLAGTIVSKQPQEAIRLHKEALKLQLHAAEQTSVDEVRREIALTYHNLGAAFSRTLQTSDAIVHYQHAAALLEGLIQESPAHNGRLRDLAVTTNNLGLVYVRTRDLPQAETAFRRSIQLHERLSELLPNDDAAWAGSAGAHANLAVALERIGRKQDSLAALSTAVERQEQAQRLAPERNRETLAKLQLRRQRIQRELQRDTAEANSESPSTSGTEPARESS